jgi:biopolymer transport protein ExbD
MKRPPKATDVGLNLAPMVDVMMCLLVFFMLATKMVEQENSQIDLPVARAAQDMDKQQLGNRLVVNVRDAALHGGEGVEYLVREDALSLDQVRGLLASEQQRDPEVNCVIRADRGVPYRDVQAVMMLCAQSDIRNITLSALRGEGEGG